MCVFVCGMCGEDRRKNMGGDEGRSLAVSGNPGCRFDRVGPFLWLQSDREVIGRSDALPPV